MTDFPDLPDISRGFARIHDEINRAAEESRRETFGHADVIFDRLMEQVRRFEANLDAAHEIGAYLTSFGREVLIRISRIGFRNPYLIIFQGTLEGGGADGGSVELVQHTSQLSVLFTALPKVPTHEQPRRIGFGN
jgi:hypothetical protein